MKLMNRYWLNLALALVASTSVQAFGQTFTLRIGPEPPPPTPLVSHGDTWRYRPGRTNAPQADWTTAANASLDGTWLTGQGGFGYGDADIVGEVTTLSMMSNNYSTLFIRREFTLPEAVDPAQRIQVTVDYDDAYVVYLDGAELGRSSNISGLGSPPPYNASTVSANHEASCCNAPTNPPSVIDFGAVGSSLGAGTHVFALMGINGGSNSSDFHLIADLSVGPKRDGPYYALVTGTNSVLVSGTNTLPGSTRVVVNGVDATFNLLDGYWSIVQSLSPGANDVLVQAFDAAGAQLFVTNKLIILETTSTRFGGAVSASTSWSPALGIIHLTNNVSVQSGATLTLEPGTVVMLEAALSLRAAAGGALYAAGTAQAPITFLHEDGSTVWGELAAEGTNSALTLRHVETIGGAVKIRNGAIGLMEDNYIHDYKSGTIPIAGCTAGQHFVVRRCHFRIYHETLWQTTLMTIEDCLFEWANNANSDALDFDGAPVGTVVRRCTFRHGPMSNTDAMDIGPTGTTGCTNTLIENCLMYDFPDDKGVSIGDNGTSTGIVISNCLIYGCLSGIMAKDSCDVTVINCTLAENRWGFTNYNKNGGAQYTGGHTTNYNSLLVSNGITISMRDNGTLVSDHSILTATNWPGVGNFSADPLFLLPAERDYRLMPGSPAFGAGRGGETLGCTYPVGAPMALSHPRIESIQKTPAGAVLGFWADNERTYSLLRSDLVSGGTWTKVADIFPTLVPRLVSLTNGAPNQARYYRLVSPAQ
ncbi:MAG TPA: right-handed parallel beta-helix repeat-containing protein [Verrucomicrobiae bacterium]|nr:right-handed parallel beta-helix repeat-containing protein [Verrucomicrobiae bacterium]